MRAPSLLLGSGCIGFSPGRFKDRHQANCRQAQISPRESLTQDLLAELPCFMHVIFADNHLAAGALAGNKFKQVEPC